MAVPQGFAFPSSDHAEEKLREKLRRVQQQSSIAPPPTPAEAVLAAAAAPPQPQPQPQPPAEKKRGRRASKEKAKRSRKSKGEDSSSESESDADEKATSKKKEKKDEANKQPRKKAKKTEEAAAAAEPPAAKKQAPPPRSRATLERYFMPKIVLPPSSSLAASSSLASASKAPPAATEATPTKKKPPTPTKHSPTSEKAREEAAGATTASAATPTKKKPPTPTKQKSSPTGKSRPHGELTFVNVADDEKPPAAPTKKPETPTKRSSPAGKAVARTKPAIVVAPHPPPPTAAAAAAAATTTTTEEASPQKRKWNPAWAAGPPDRSALNPHCKPMPVGKKNCLQGIVFTVTGRLESLDRDEVTALIQEYGGQVQQAAGKRVTHVVLGEGGGESKTRAIKERGLKVLTEDQLFEMIRTLPEKADDPKRKAAAALKQKRTAAATPHLSTATVSGTPVVSSASRSAPASAAAPSDGKMWVDRYVPKSVSEMIFANRAYADRFARWLRNWAIDGKPRAEGKRAWPAVLLSGAPGIGKTTLARLACKEAGFVPLEFNASDTRSKRSIKEDVQEALSNRTITSFIGGGSSSKPPPACSALIMDEVDGMSAGDRGGVAEIILLLKTTRIPVICICNDRQSTKVRSLAKHCMDLRLERPSPDQLAVRLTEVARTEGFGIATDAARRIAISSNCDIRQSLHLLHLYSLGVRRGGQIHVGDVQGLSKDVDVTAFDVAPRLFTFLGTSLEQKLRWYFSDRDMLPLLVQENYTSARPRSLMSPNPTPHIQLVSSAAEDISISDVISTTMRSQNQWHLSSIHAVTSCVLPCFAVQGSLSVAAFPSWLGKTSTGNKNKRLLTELQTHMRLTTNSTTQQDIAMDILPMLARRLSEPLVARGAGGIDEVIELMNAYKLSREDWDTVIDLHGAKPPKIESAVMSSFTRKFNAQSVAVAAAVSKGRGGIVGGAAGESETASSSLGEREIEADGQASSTLGVGDEEDEDVADEGEDDDLKHDRLIKQHKKTSSTATTTSSSSSRRKTTDSGAKRGRRPAPKRK